MGFSSFGIVTLMLANLAGKRGIATVVSLVRRNINFLIPLNMYCTWYKVGDEILSCRVDPNHYHPAAERQVPRSSSMQNMFGSSDSCCGYHLKL